MHRLAASSDRPLARVATRSSAAAATPMPSRSGSANTSLVPSFVTMDALDAFTPAAPSTNSRRGSGGDGSYVRHRIPAPAPSTGPVTSVIPVPVRPRPGGQRGMVGLGNPNVQQCCACTVVQIYRLFCYRWAPMLYLFGLWRWDCCLVGIHAHSLVGLFYCMILDFVGWSGVVAAVL